MLWRVPQSYQLKTSRDMTKQFRQTKLINLSTTRLSCRAQHVLQTDVLPTLLFSTRSGYRNWYVRKKLDIDFCLTHHKTILQICKKIKTGDTAQSCIRGYVKLMVKPPFQYAAIVWWMEDLQKATKNKLTISKNWPAYNMD